MIEVDDNRKTIFEKATREEGYARAVLTGLYGKEPSETVIALWMEKWWRFRPGRLSRPNPGAPLLSIPQAHEREARLQHATKRTGDPRPHNIPKESHAPVRQF